MRFSFCVSGHISLHRSKPFHVCAYVSLGVCVCECPLSLRLFGQCVWPSCYLPWPHTHIHTSGKGTHVTDRTHTHACHPPQMGRNARVGQYNKKGKIYYFSPFVDGRWCRWRNTPHRNKGRREASSLFPGGWREQGGLAEGTDCVSLLGVDFSRQEYKDSAISPFSHSGHSTDCTYIAQRKKRNGNGR